MAAYTEMNNMQLTQLVKKLEEELESLRRTVKKSGGAVVIPDPLTLSKLILDASFPQIKFISTTAYGEDIGYFNIAHLGAGMTLDIDFDVVNIKGTQIYP